MATVPALAILYPTLLAAFATRNNYTIFPDEHGVPYLVDLNVQLLSAQDLDDLQQNVNRIQFTLHTRANRGGEQLTLDNAEVLKNSNWDPNNPTRFVTHGWRGDSNVESCTTILDAFLDVGEYNVITVDWGTISGNILYGKVVRSVPAVARQVTKMMTFLRDEGQLDLSTTKLIGHSLGAHVAGLAAFYMAGRVAEVVALDPAKPMYENASIQERVDAVDAEHVQVIHTNGGILGILEPIGTSDFYPNNGQKQPGCSFTDIFGACSHSRSYLYYAESIRNPTGFPGRSRSSPLPNGGKVQAFMGGPSLDPSAKGAYILNTNSQPPYGTV